MPESLRCRAVRYLFASAGSGPAGALVTTFVVAFPLAMLERWLWLPAPVSLPLCIPVVGLLFSLAGMLPRRLAPALALGAAAGELAGLLVPGVGPAGTPLAFDLAVRLAATHALAGALGGVLLNLAFERFRPPLDRRFVVGVPFGAIGALVGAVPAAASLPHEGPAALLWLSAALAQGLGMLVVGTMLNVWWLYAHGLELLHRSRRVVLGLEIAAIAALLVAMRVEWLGLTAPIYALLIAMVLAGAGLRFPLRTSAPFASTACLATMLVLADASGTGRPPWLGELQGVVALQLGVTFAISCIYMQSAAFTARLLFEQRLRQYARQLEVAEDEHRRVTASAVREGVSQSLAGVRFALSALNGVGLPPSARRSLDETLDMVRSAERDAELAHREFGPDGLDDHDIATVLDAYLRRLAQSTDVELALDARGALETLPPRMRQLAFRIVSDLVGSAVRERVSRRMHVAVEATPEALRLVVRDLGNAFAVAPALLAPDSRSRLALLRERVLLEGGDLQLRAANDDGTAVHVILPVRSA